MFTELYLVYYLPFKIFGKYVIMIDIEHLARVYCRLFEGKTYEANIETDKLYFHGSANGNIKKFYAPTPAAPLFVTADIDYANEYLQAAHPNGHAKFNEDESPGKVYLVDLDFSKIKMFDASDESDRERMKKYWPSYILDQLKTRRYSIWSVFRYAVPQMRKFYVDYKRNFNEFSTAIKNDVSFKDDMGKDIFLQVIQFMDKLYGNELTKIFASKSADDALFDIIALFNKTLMKQGYNAFRNTEVMRATNKRKTAIKTNNVIGIMDDDCIKDLSPKPLDPEMVKQAIDDLKTDDLDVKNYSKSNQTLIDQVVNKIEDK